jgi:hypothetical protein
MVYIRAALATAPQEGLGIPSQYLKLRLDGSILDSIALPVEGATGAFVLQTADGSRWSFPARAVFALLPTGDLLTANTSSYRFTLATQRFRSHPIERAVSPIPVSGVERSEWEAFARYIASRSARPGPPAEIPPVKPALRDIFADPDGRLWVHLYTRAAKRTIPPRPAGDPRPLLTVRELNVYDLFNLRGVYLGRLELPPQSLLMAVSGDRIWVRTEEEGGEYTLTRFRIGGLPPG